MLSSDWSVFSVRVITASGSDDHCLSPLQQSDEIADNLRFHGSSNWMGGIFH